jgi:hypothetical protein
MEVMIAPTLTPIPPNPHADVSSRLHPAMDRVMEHSDYALRYANCEANFNSTVS